MVNYSNGKIYKIISYQFDKCCVGSTCSKLCVRMAKHRSVYKTGKKYYSSAEILKYGDAKILLIEDYPCDNKEQLTKREGYWIKQLDCVNKNVAGRTGKEYHEDNKEKILIQKKEYYEANKEKISIQKKQYYEDNKDKLSIQRKQPVTCECGASVRKDSLLRHKKSKKHIQYLQNKKYVD